MNGKLKCNTDQVSIKNSPFKNCHKIENFLSAVLLKISAEYDPLSIREFVYFTPPPRFYDDI